MSTYESYYGGDWLEVDTSKLPTKQLPLLRDMIGRRLMDIQRSITDYELPSKNPSSPDFARPQDILRKAGGPVIIEMEGLSLIYFDDTYYAHEFSIGVTIEPLLRLTSEARGYARRYTLHDSQTIDERLSRLPGQRLVKIRILIRRPRRYREKAQALQDGIELTFENGTTIIISYYLNALRGDYFQILYPEEIPWHDVEYTVDVARPRISWRYRFNYWKWRALERLGRRLGLG